MKKRKADLKSFLKKVKELRGFGDMNSYKLVKDYNLIAEKTAQDGIDNIIEALSNPHTFEEVKNKMAVNAGRELDQMNGDL